MNLVNAIALSVAVAALWITRRSWGIPWERPAVINVTLQAIDIFLALPAVNPWVSNQLHGITGLWNVEELIGHACYITGMFSLLYLVADRLDMTPRQFRTFVRLRIELPATFCLAIMMALFVPAFGHAYVPDTIATQTYDWMHAYWTVMCWTIGYILIQFFNALRVLRLEPANQKTAQAYRAAGFVSVLCCLAFVFEIEPVQWVLVRCEMVGYALAASYVWRIKVKDLQRA